MPKKSVAEIQIKSDMTETQTPTKHSSKKKLAAVIGYVSNLTVACAVMMWGVFNVSLNLLSFKNDQTPDQAWWITAIIVAITCVVPFLIGLKLLSKTLVNK
ncbi:MAG: hypothetical protein AB8B55_01665 [Mariniblastus sp.]